METSFTSVGIFTLLGLGLIFGLKHATEVDHIVAVSTIVSQHRSITRSALVGALWGLGHTAALVIVGVVVLAFRIAIPLSVANWLEFSVALMIICLGVLSLRRALTKRSNVHVHQHSHEGVSHIHVHFHERAGEHRGHPAAHSHEVSGIGAKPLVVGALHGLAGSAALTLLVMTQIESMLLGLLYLGVFGLGSVVGMLLMSGLIGLPFAFSGGRLTKVNYGLQTIAGSLSVVFGLWYAYQIGINNFN